MTVKNSKIVTYDNSVIRIDLSRFIETPDNRSITLVTDDQPKKKRAELGKFDQLQKLSEFSLSKKMTYGRMTDIISDTMNLMFENNPSLVMRYIMIQMGVYVAASQSKDYTVERVIKESMNLIENEYEYVKSYVDSTFIGETEEIEGYKNKELQFTEEHSKILLCTGMMARFVIPLVTNFMRVYNVKREDDIFINIVVPVMNKFSTMYQKEGQTINMVNKLKRLIDSRVLPTMYSDRIIWNYLPNSGMNPIQYTNVLNRKILADIIPKLRSEGTDPDSSISFLHVVIRNQLKYLFRAKLPISYKSLNVEIEHDEANIFDRQFSAANTNELAVVLAQVQIRSVVGKMRKRVEEAYRNHNIKKSAEITYEEYEYYSNLVPITTEQYKLVFLFYMQYMSDYETFYTVTKRDYYELLILMVRYLEILNFKRMSKTLLSRVCDDSKVSAHRSTVSKKLILEIQSMNKFKQLREKKYKFISEKFENSDYILQLIEDFTKHDREFPEEYGSANMNELVKMKDNPQFIQKEVAVELLLLVTTVLS